MESDRESGTRNDLSILNGKPTSRAGRSMHPQTTARQEPYVWVNAIETTLSKSRRLESFIPQTSISYGFANK